MKNKLLLIVLTCIILFGSISFGNQNDDFPHVKSFKLNNQIKPLNIQ